MMDGWMDGCQTNAESNAKERIQSQKTTYWVIPFI
jgi:hypothetical protein